MTLTQIVPPHLDVLSSRLPGDPSDNFKTIIQENTLFPLFLPFIGRSNFAMENQKDAWYGGLITHMPRRVVGKHGESNLCLDCLIADETEHGLAYWHREHQAPGVTICWKHRKKLISSCPNCSFPFQRHNKLLTAPWIPCRCRHDLKSTITAASESELDQAYAIFVYDLLQASYSPIPPKLLAQTYRAKIKQKGFIWGAQAHMIDFTESMISSLGEEFIARVDPAYSAKKTRFWLRFNIVDGAMDIPITRHILLGMHLFGTAAKMMEAVWEQKKLLENAHAKPLKSEKLLEQPNNLRNEHRKRILLEKKRAPSITMQGMWKRALRAMEWLFDNDKMWLEKVLLDSNIKHSTGKKLGLELDAQQDEKYANLVEQHARHLLEKNEKPQRITQGKLLSSLPKKIHSDLASREKYPLLFARIAQCRESSWCFGARRILWAITEMKHNEQTITPGNIRLASSVGHHAVCKILEFTGWDCVALAGSRIHIPTALAKAGIGLTWLGPESLAMAEIGGRSYVKQRPESANKHLKIMTHFSES